MMTRRKGSGFHKCAGVGSSLQRGLVSVNARGGILAAGFWAPPWSSRRPWCWAKGLPGKGVLGGHGAQTLRMSVFLARKAGKFSATGKFSDE